MNDLLELIPIELLDILFSYADKIHRYLIIKYPLLLTDVDWAQAHFPEVLKRNPYYWDSMIEKMVRDYNIPNFCNNIYTNIIATLKHKLSEVSNKVKYFKKIFKVFTSIKYGSDNAYRTDISLTAEKLRPYLLSTHQIETFNRQILNYGSSGLSVRFYYGRQYNDMAVRILHHGVTVIILTENIDLAAEMFLELMFMKNYLI
jgi:hypothetical protein